MPNPYNGNAANATGTQVTITDPVDGDDLTAASGTLPWNKEADWLQRLANIALNIATTAWTFTQAIIMQSTLAVTGAISGASLAVTGAVTAASATLSGMPGSLTAVTATLSGLLTGVTATFSGLLTANGGIATMTPLTVGGTGVAFQNSFTGATAGANPPRYWKDAFSVVHLDGGLTNAGTTVAVAFTLPSGFRPGIQQNLGGFDSTAHGVTDVVVDTNGNVTVNITAGNTVWLGFTFPTF